MMKNLLKQQTVALEKANAALTRETRQRQEAQSHPKETHTEIEHLIASIPTILIGLSKDNRIVHWNAKAEKILGISAATVMGRPMSQCGMDWDWEKIEAGITRSREQHGSVRVDDIPFRCSNDEQRYLGITINPLNGDGRRILGLTIIGADITERKKLEARLQQSHKMEAIGQLAAGIAHEINTPTQFVGDNTRFFQDAFDDLFNIIKEYEQLLSAASTRPLTAEQIAAAQDRIEEFDLDYLRDEIPVAIEHTLKGVERIAKIVQAMKIFSHPGMADKEPTDINAEIEKTITITRNEWKYVADLETDFDASLPPVPCFRAELNQVILNMIVNASHAIIDANGGNSSKKGLIRIRTAHEENRVRIYISDTGAGIPEEIQHKIFDLFFTTKEPGRGTGQGLAIAHSVIVEKHGGTLDLESPPGQGATFIIGLPMQTDSETNG